MSNWRSWNIGDTIRYSWNDFDGHGSLLGTLAEMHEDHAIVKADGMNLWLSDETADMFSRESENRLLSLAESHPDLLGMRGRLTYMICSVIPENADLTDMELTDVLAYLPDQHIEYMYNIGNCETRSASSQS